MRYNITPVPAPRMTQRDKWARRPCVMRYFTFRDEIKRLGITVKPYDSIVFTMPMPKSWSKKKKLEHNGRAHKAKPDLDNLCKALLDSIFEDDSHIHALTLLKVWGYEGEIVINDVQPF